MFVWYEHLGVTCDIQVVAREASKWPADFILPCLFSPDSTAADEKAEPSLLAHQLKGATAWKYSVNPLTRSKH